MNLGQVSNATAAIDSSSKIIESRIIQKWLRKGSHVRPILSLTHLQWNGFGRWVAGRAQEHDLGVWSDGSLQCGLVYLEGGGQRALGDWHVIHLWEREKAAHTARRMDHRKWI